MNSSGSDPSLWSSRISAADSPESVIAIVNDFLASFPDVSKLPAECRLAQFSTAEEISNCAYTLIRELRPGASSALETAAAVFALAAQRIPQILVENQRRAEREAFFVQAWPKRDS